MWCSSSTAVNSTENHGQARRYGDRVDARPQPRGAGGADPHQHAVRARSAIRNESAQRLEMKLVDPLDFVGPGTARPAAQPGQGGARHPRAGPEPVRVRPHGGRADTGQRGERPGGGPRDRRGGAPGRWVDKAATVIRPPESVLLAEVVAGIDGPRRS